MNLSCFAIYFGCQTGARAPTQSVMTAATLDMIYALFRTNIAMADVTMIRGAGNVDQLMLCPASKQTRSVLKIHPDGASQMCGSPEQIIPLISAMRKAVVGTFSLDPMRFLSTLRTIETSIGISPTSVFGAPAATASAPPHHDPDDDVLHDHERGDDHRGLQG